MQKNGHIMHDKVPAIEPNPKFLMGITVSLPDVTGQLLP